MIRRFDSLAQREQMEDAYYVSDDWRKGPREVMLALMENYTDVVLELDEVTVQGLRISSYVGNVLQFQKFGNSDFLEKCMSTIQIRGKGTITLPASLRKKYNLEEGEVLTVIDLGGGSILLRPMVSQIDVLSRRAAKTLKDDNVTLDEILETLDEERKKYFNEKYGKKE